MADPYSLRWGILATGQIAEKFAHDLLIDPVIRQVTDVKHTLIGVASSRCEETARTFLAQVNAPSDCRAYGDYQSLVQDPDIDIVYIATPHSHHFQNAMLALHGGKHVLCEKAFTVNVNQARKLFDTAERRKLFLMESMSMPFLPVGAQVRQVIHDGVVGHITRIFADNGLGMHPVYDLPPGDRRVKKELAGGALLDLGVSSIHWVFQALHTLQHPQPTALFALVAPFEPYEVDETATIMMQFDGEAPQAPPIHAVASASLRATTDADGESPSVRIQGDLGEIQIYGWPWRPSKYRLVTREPGFGNLGVAQEFPCQIPGGAHGLCYAADEAARCIRDSLLQSNMMPWKLTLRVMEIVDAVRESTGLSFPGDIETADYPVALDSRDGVDLISPLYCPS